VDDELTIAENYAFRVFSSRFVSFFHFDFLFTVCVFEQIIILSVELNVYLTYSDTVC